MHESKITLAMLMLDSIAEYPENWMFIISKDRKASQCLGCLSQNLITERDMEEETASHYETCPKDCAEIAISRYELIKALEDIARLEYNQELNDNISRDILLRGGLWVNAASRIGWLLSENGNYRWTGNLQDAMEYFNITDNDFNETPRLDYPKWEADKRSANNG
jgi:hypothetical protein